MQNQTNTTKVRCTYSVSLLYLVNKGSSCIKMHNVVTDNCKKIRPKYQPTTVWMSELKAVLEMTTTHLHTSWKTTACGASWKKRCIKHASLILTTSNIASELSGPSWITPSLLQLCVSGVASFSSCEGGWWSFRALLLILTFEQLSVDIPVWFSCSCQLWRCVF